MLLHITRKVLSFDGYKKSGKPQKRSRKEKKSEENNDGNVLTPINWNKVIHNILDNIITFPYIHDITVKMDMYKKNCGLEKATKNKTISM